MSSVTLTAGVPTSLGYKISEKLQKAASASLGFTRDVVTTLGARGLDGQPLALKVLSALAKVLEDWNPEKGDILYEYALGIRKFVQYAGKPLANVGAVLAPLTGFEDLINDISGFAQAIFNGTVEKKYNCVVKHRDVAGQLTDTFKFEHKKTEAASSAAKAEALIKVVATTSGWLSDVANAVAKIAELELLAISSHTLEAAARIGNLCSRVFAYVGAGGTIVKFAMAAYRLHTADKTLSVQDRLVLETSFKHATVALIKTALRISLLVWASYFSLAYQGALALAMIGMDIYTNRTKKQALQTIEVTATALPVAAS
jgi:hypothetical protein